MLKGKVALVVFGSTLVGGGGVERRFGRAFRRLRSKGQPVYLITNESMYHSLLEAGVLQSDDGVIRYQGCANPTITHAFQLTSWLLRTCRELRIDLVHLIAVQKVLVPYYLHLALGGQRDTAITCTVALATLSAEARVPLGIKAVSQLIWWRSDAIDSLYHRFTEKNAFRYGSKLFTTPCSFTDYDVFTPEYPKKPWVVFSGRLRDEKGPLLYIDCVAELVRREPERFREWHFYVLGSGPLKEEIMRRVKKYGIVDRVTIDAVANVAPIIRRSSVFLSLQRWENYPSQSLIEAMACENCVVVTDVGETRRLVDESRGLLVDSFIGPQELANVVSTAMADEQLRNRLGRNAAAFVRSNHRLEVFESYLVQFWNEALLRKRRGR